MFVSLTFNVHIAIYMRTKGTNRLLLKDIKAYFINLYRNMQFSIFVKILCIFSIDRLYLLEYKKIENLYTLFLCKFTANVEDYTIIVTMALAA